MGEKAIKRGKALNVKALSRLSSGRLEAETGMRNFENKVLYAHYCLENPAKPARVRKRLRRDNWKSRDTKGTEYLLRGFVGNFLCTN